MFLNLNRLKNYDFRYAFKLRAKNEDDLLQSFYKNYKDLFNVVLKNETLMKTLKDLKFHIISLIRDLLKLFNDKVKSRQHALD